jgi:hypothetical protein
VNAIFAGKRIRSANAPVINAGVMTANISWKIMNVCCGIVVE